MEGFLKALENGTEYEYIANHGHEIPKDELIFILKEYIYGIHSMKKYDTREDVQEEIYENLQNYIMGD